MRYHRACEYENGHKEPMAVWVDNCGPDLTPNSTTIAPPAERLRACRKIERDLIPQSGTIVPFAASPPERL